MDNINIKKPKILFLLDNPFTNDRRVYREAKTLTDNGYQLTLIAVGNNDLPKAETVDGIRVNRILNDDIFDPKKFNCFDKYASEITNNFEFDIVHAHDQTMLHLACKIKKLKPQIKLIYDSHELFHAWPLNISNYNNRFIWIKSLIVRKLLTIRERSNRKKIDYIITVNKSLADDLSQYLHAKKAVTVIRNIPEKTEIAHKSNVLRVFFNIPEETKILVFIGANIYAKTLNLEQVIDEIANCENKALVFICAFNQNSKPVIDYVKSKNINNVYFHQIISPKDIPTYLSSANVGLVPTWNNKDLSYWYALDNKLFEYIHAGIPVLATQQPEYVNIIEPNQCGICVNPDIENAYINGFEKILENHELYSEKTKETSKLLCWENEEKELLMLYNSIENG
ncbi:MAG: glycosyltransferase [Bacteroidota bacterium]